MVRKAEMRRQFFEIFHARGFVYYGTPMRPEMTGETGGGVGSVRWVQLLPYGELTSLGARIAQVWTGTWRTSGGL
jgi:hypothetical protein